MKKMKKLLALLLVAVMVLSGCKKEEATMFTVMEDAGEMTKYSYEITAEIESTISGMEEAAIVLKGETDGKRTSLGIEVDYLFFSLELEELLIVDKDAIYINAEEILALAETYIGYDVEDMLGMELKWIELPYAEGLINTSNTEESTKLVRSILEAAFAENEQTDKDGVHTVAIDGIDELITFVENFAEALEENKDELIKLSAGQDTDAATDAVKATVNLYMDAMISAVEKFSADNDLGITDEDIEEMKASVEAELENLNLDTETDTEDAMEEAFDELEEAFEELIDGLNEVDKDKSSIDFTMSNSLTGKEGSREYTAEINLEIIDDVSDDEIKLVVESVMKEDKDLEVDIPKNVTELEELIYGILDFAYNSGLMGDFDMGVTPVEPESEEPATEEPTTGGASPSISRPSQSDEENVVELIDYYNDKYVARVTYNTDMVVLDQEYSALEQGDACFNLATDEWTYWYVGTYDFDYTEDYIEFLLEFYTEDLEYTNISVTDVTEVIINNYTFDIYQVSYTDGSYDYTEDCFVLKLTDGFVIAGESTCFYGNKEISAEEMLSYIFVDVEVLEADGATVPVEKESGSGNNTTPDIGESVTINHVADSTETLTFYGWESVIDLTYDSSLVQLDESYTAVETGEICMELVDDSFTYMFIDASDYYESFEEYYEWEVDMYDYYSDVEVSEAYELYVGNIIINRFDITYKYGTEQYFYIDLGNGESVYGSTSDFTSGYAEGSMDEFLSYVFVKLELGDGVAPSQVEYDGTVELVCLADDSTFVIEYDTEKLEVENDPYYTYPAKGRVCFNYIEDIWTYLCFEIGEYATAQDVYDEYIEFYKEYYNLVSATEITELSVGDVVVNRFDITYKISSSEYIAQFYVIELGNGSVLFGNSEDYSSGYTDATLEEMLEWIFG